MDLGLEVGSFLRVRGGSLALGKKMLRWGGLEGCWCGRGPAEAAIWARRDVAGVPPVGGDGGKFNRRRGNIGGRLVQWE
jgi:hypothetical protein